MIVVGRVVGNRVGSRFVDFLLDGSISSFPQVRSICFLFLLKPVFLIHDIDRFKEI